MVHKYQSVQLKMPPIISESVKTFQAEILPGILNIAEGGLEDRPHVTILYGLEDRAKADIEKIFADFGPVTVWFGKVKAFLAAETGKSADVLYVEVLGREVDILHLLVAAYLPTVSTNPFFKPHMTLAYLMPGEAAPFIGESYFEGQKATVDKIEFAETNEDISTIKLAEEMEIEGRTYARVPESVRTGISGSMAAAFEYVKRDGKGWVPKRKLDALIKLMREIRTELKNGN